MNQFFHRLYLSVYFVNIGSRDEFDWMSLKDFLKETLDLGRDDVFKVLEFFPRFLQARPVADDSNRFLTLAVVVLDAALDLFDGQLNLFIAQPRINAVSSFIRGVVVDVR